MPTMYIVNQARQLQLMPNDNMVNLPIHSGVSHQAKAVLDGAFGEMDSEGNFSFNQQLSNASAIFQGGGKMKFDPSDLIKVEGSVPQLDVLQSHLAYSLKTRWAQAYDQAVQSMAMQRAAAQVNTPSMLQILFNAERQRALQGVEQFNTGKERFAVNVVLVSNPIDVQSVNAALEDAENEYGVGGQAPTFGELLAEAGIADIYVDNATPVVAVPNEPQESNQEFSDPEYMRGSIAPNGVVAANAVFSVIAVSAQEAIFTATTLSQYAKSHPDLEGLLLKNSLRIMQTQACTPNQVQQLTQGFNRVPAFGLNENLQPIQPIDQASLQAQSMFPAENVRVNLTPNTTVLYDIYMMADRLIVHTSMPQSSVAFDTAIPYLPEELNQMDTLAKLDTLKAKWFSQFEEIFKQKQLVFMDDDMLSDVREQLWTPVQERLICKTPTEIENAQEQESTKPEEMQETVERNAYQESIRGEF